VGSDEYLILVEREKDGEMFYFHEEFETVLQENLSDGLCSLFIIKFTLLAGCRC